MRKRNLAFSDLIGWSNDGNWLYTLEQTNQESAKRLWRTHVTGATSESLCVLPEDVRPWGMTPDGRGFVYAKIEGPSDVWMITDFDPDMEVSVVR